MAFNEEKIGFWRYGWRNKYPQLMVFGSVIAVMGRYHENPWIAAIGGGMFIAVLIGWLMAYDNYEHPKKHG